jgi:hypothetical protein
MLRSAFDLGEEMKLRTLEYITHPDLWDKFIIPAIDLSFVNWTSIKYLNDDATAFNDDISQVPNDTGGLYLFYIKCSIITGITEYPCYIGRAQLTEKQNLRKRVREYFTHYARDDERPKITKMINYWGKQLYLAFLPLPNNAFVVDFEKGLINSLLLPMNDKIPDQEISQGISAF